MEVVARPQDESLRFSARASIRIPLTQTEQEILRMVANGVSRRAIARRLKLKDGEVGIGLASVFEKLAFARRLELLSPDGSWTSPRRDIRAS